MKTVLVAGQKHFGMAVADLVQSFCGWTVVAVSAPVDSLKPDQLATWAQARFLPVIPAGQLSVETIAAHCPYDLDLIITAHCHDFITRSVRELPSIGALGYHPSLLPIWRGKRAIECQIEARDRVTGGTVYWLDHIFDGGPIAAQRHAIVPVGSTAASLWRDVLQPLGLDLLAETLSALSTGTRPAVPQCHELATHCPAA